MYKPQEILAELNTFLTLNDGDIVMTGTPKGVGIIYPDAKFSARVFQNNREILSANWTAV
jgi:2-keto-4-pentenoate hydratase/2-oxohepta-3-ene-1,7-dioic acid hydratase in catechol pathway